MAAKKNQKRLKLLLVIEIGIGLILALVAVALFQNWQQLQSILPERAVLPTGPDESARLDTPGLATTLPTLEITGNKTPGATHTPYVTPIKEPVTVCGGPPSMMILALGIDNLENNYFYGLADVIRVVRVDFVKGKVSVLALPRDLWVEIPGLEDRGITNAKLNTAYYYGTETYGHYDGPDLGPGFMIETLKLNYGLRIDNYITLTMESVEKVIDAVGGIDVTLPYNLDGKSSDPDDPFDLGFFEKGTHHFDGETAVRFARIRMVDSDYYRISRQSMVLSALWEKAVSPAILPHIPQLVYALYGSVQMNLSANDIRYLACLAPQLSSDTLTFASIPLDMLEEDRITVERYNNPIFVWKVDEAALDRLMRDFQNGHWPSPEP
jgi:LCP family protein required for cell wall assembly